MSEFDELLAQYTAKGAGKIHGVIATCVDKHGNEIYSKVAGYDSIAPDAAPLNADAALKVGSATKLITSIALLQCIEQGLIGLDEPVDRILPELKNKPIITGETSDGDFTYAPSTVPITPRHLLTHTSGLGYYFLGPLLTSWSAKTPEGRRGRASKLVRKRFDAPLSFEPGTGWLYGTGLEWAGEAVRRLHGGVSLTDYFVEHIWKPLGLRAPYPTFNLPEVPEYAANRMMGAQRAQDGSLEPFEFTFGHNAADQEGGAGLVARARDFAGVLADLAADEPRLLKRDTLDMVFATQLEPRSAQTEMLMQLRPAWDNVSGPVAGEEVNHGLAGLLLRGEAAELGQPGGDLLAWGGALNTVWFVSRELGVGGFFSTQVSPFADPEANRLINAWKKDFWAGYWASRGEHGGAKGSAL